jgi:hypothetical protein
MKRFVFFVTVFILVLTSIGAETCVPYNRSDYPHWIDEDRDCQNIRHEVLIAESLVPVQFMTESQCRVVSGKWIDPFTGQVFTDPSELDIDHVVPLKEAHESGAWQWDAEKRRRFANCLAFHNGQLIL